jgi:transcriptional regulator with XRE-family HTH domain
MDENPYSCEIPHWFHTLTVMKSICIDRLGALRLAARLEAARRLQGSGDGMATAVARILDDLRGRGGLQGKDIANIVDVSTATVSRWSRGNGTPSLHTQTIIAELRYVVERLSDFYTPDETRLWLHARHPLLKNERAIDLINAGRTEEVLAVIERLESGAYI